MITTATRLGIAYDQVGLARSQDTLMQAAAMQGLRMSGYSHLGKLKCEVTDGVVGLRGKVPSFFLKQMAQAVVLKVEKVRAVENWVEVQEDQVNSNPRSEEE